MSRLGAAAMKIELSEGIITVYHGTCGTVLKQFRANENSWNLIWQGILNAQSIAAITDDVIIDVEGSHE
jgi:hypothetical protein